MNCVAQRGLASAVGLCLAFSLTSCTCADPVDELVQTEMQKQKIPGLALIVLKRGQVVKTGAYGVADTESRERITADTVFRIQSVSKQFTAMGVMILVEAGKLQLDDPIRHHLENCPSAWNEITVRHLLNQTSGLSDFINESPGDLKEDSSDQKLMGSIADRPLKFQPGEAWDYSNSNYLLLAMIIGKVSGQWYGDYLADTIFKPLGMTNTSVVGHQSKTNSASGYTLENGRLRRATVLSRAVEGYGGGGIQSTILDLARWDAALYTERLVKRAMLDLVWRPARLNNGSTHPYGFGWELGHTAQHRIVSHAGKWLGFAAQIDRYPDDELTVIALCNLSSSSLSRVTRAVAGAFIPALQPAVYTSIPDREPEMTARFMDVLQRAGEGKLREDEFAPDIWAYLGPRSTQIKSDMAAIGPIQQLTLVERTEDGGTRSYRYRARFKFTSFIYHFVVAPDGRISVMMPEQVNQ